MLFNDKLSTCTTQYSVTDASGHLTPAASLAHKLCNHCSTYHMMIHVVPLARSYHVQQTMMLVEMFNSINNSSVKQVHLDYWNACPVETITSAVIVFIYFILPFRFVFCTCSILLQQLPCLLCCVVEKHPALWQT